jgi:hypothetical protein
MRSLEDFKNKNSRLMDVHTVLAMFEAEVRKGNSRDGFLLF